ncbi:DUF5916 domain-containing protein [Foetidibacter luteolus]|uniref:DUF5916 domain-containing protein n=1 Tax=Foetidibacter luteolus TaxID=2608880 RepID=UPI00129B22AA|nr:DUF5916 domain-containing protein [Foetidibacter luteolus]
MRLLLLVFFFIPVAAATQNSFTDSALHIARLPGPVTIDGLSNETAWQQVPPIHLYVLEPVYGAKPADSTEILVAYDDRFLYVAARCYYRNSAAIVARNYVRDGWRGDDWFAFDIDANNDHQNAIRFALYPFGSHFDMAIGNDAVEMGSSTFNSNYNLIWQGKCALNQEGWFMEMKIPFAALRFKPTGGKTIMNISATRQSYYTNELQHYPRIPQTVVDGARKPSLKQPAYFENIKPARLLYIVPSLATGINRVNKLDNNAGGYHTITNKQFKPSLDIKYSISPQLIADLTVNTDFAQAEIDDQQFNLSRFSLFYPERRLFFQEQAGLFEFRLGSASQLFYSRVIGLKDGNIIPVAGGARVTGKLGKTDIGLMNIQTSSATINDSVYTAAENFSVVRTRHKTWNESSYIGTMLTNRTDGRNNNIALGADAFVRVSGFHYVSGAVATTQNTGNKAALLTGSRALLNWELRRRDGFFYNLQYGYSGKDFSPGLGFIDRSNFHNGSAKVSYARFGANKNGLFRYKKASWANDVYWNAATGKHESLQSLLELTGTTFKNHVLSIKAQYNKEFLVDSLQFGSNLFVRPGNYNFGQFTLGYQAPEYLVFKLKGTLSYGTFYDGNRTSLYLSPTWSINRFFDLQGAYNLERIRFSNRQVSSVIHYGSIKLAWAFNLHLSGQLQLQYNSDADKLLTNGRVRYHFSDGHDVYLVYTQTFYQNRYKQSPALPAFEQQQILVKYIYSFH